MRATGEARAGGRYLLLISIHGLIRGHGLELGRDADTGGQTRYVVELARALACQPGVARVDLVTRRVQDPRVSADYAEPLEQLCERARIVRIDAGPAEYLPKEQLWDHLDSFLDNLLAWLRTQPRPPDIVHSHYADAGYVGVRLSNLLGVPLLHTGHSLGRDKRNRLLASGLERERIEQRYNISRRIDAEEQVLANADLVIASTNNEIEEQYGLYNFHDPARMAVIPPGADLARFHPPTADEDPRGAIAAALPRFLREPGKPLILALSRPDERKNILSLVEAYGETPALREAANLLIVAGTREDIRDLDDGARTVLNNILLLIDSHDLYGKVALPKQHSADEVPCIYRLVCASGGVFVNPALTEPFGLTLLEAAASGLPVVATENGGPVDIVANCRNGLLVDPLDREALAAALLQLLGNRSAWEEAARNGIAGVREHYSWSRHAERYLAAIDTLSLRAQDADTGAAPAAPGAPRYRDRALFSDLDQNLLGDRESLGRLVAQLRDARQQLCFGIATGRRLDSALALLKKHAVPVPDVLISSLGTRIHYGPRLVEDEFWAAHIDHNWQAAQVRRVLAEVPGLELQPRHEQTPFKISWYYDPRKAPAVEEIVALLHREDLTANVIAAFGQYLDIVPSRASKGQALRYVAGRLDIALDHILAAGGSGADEDMMRGNTLAAVVANRHHEELSRLIDVERIYFSSSPHAEGILEAIAYYDFLGACRDPRA